MRAGTAKACARAATLSLALAAGAPLLAAPAGAADYYAGKTIELIVGGGPGGGYDIYARTVARHLPRHIPGEPNIVVKNMPGAGSTKAAHYITTMAAKDGTAVGAIMPGAIVGPLLDDRAKPSFDPTKVRYLGTANSGTRVCVTMKTSRIRTFDDARKIKAKFGGSAPHDSTYEYGYLHKHTSGTAWDMVAGYPGTPDMALAMERGEIDGICGWDWSSFKSQKGEWLRDNKVNVLLQVSLDPHPELTKMGVPSVFKHVNSDADRQVVELVISQSVFQRSYIVPPETPEAQLAVLRAAFDKTVADPRFLADAAKARIDIAPLSGAKVQEVVARLYRSPKDIVARAKKAIRPE
jgi:tripartite-type tricarboxylate transporter receptor subunit TctC